MRILLLFCTLMFSVTVLYAQQPVQGTGDQLLSKRGQPILPEAGSFGLGFDAVPFLEYFGNIFNNTANNSVGAGFPGFSQQVFGKYILNSGMAVRARGRLNQDIITNKNLVMFDDPTAPDPDVQVTDKWTEYNTFVRLGGGVEFRRGTGRVIGVYGGEASLLYGRNSVKYDYGNPITEDNQAPTTTPGFGGVNGGQFERLSSEKNNQQLGFGISGFAGVEYFLAPKISLGAEFTLGLDLIKDYRVSDTFEYWDDTSGSLETRSTESEGGSFVSLDTGNYGGSINLMFYF